MILLLPDYTFLSTDDLLEEIVNADFPFTITIHVRDFDETYRIAWHYFLAHGCDHVVNIKCCDDDDDDCDVMLLFEDGEVQYNDDENVNLLARILTRHHCGKE